jgi:hypothetical protein
VVDEVEGAEMVPRLFEYGPNVIIRSRQGNGAEWGARMPGIAVKAWLDAMESFQPSPHDFTGYQPVLKKAAVSVGAAGPDMKATIKAVAPALNLGLDEGSGSLIPVATASARDLLGYGWEIMGLQFGYSYRFFGDVPPGPSDVGRTVLDQIKGVDVYFRNSKVSAHFPLKDLRRLQFVGSSLVGEAFLRKLPDDWRNPPECYLSRCWLARGGNREIESFIRNGGKAEDVRIFVNRMRHEGGPLAVCNLVNHDGNTKFPAFIDVLGMRDELLADMPWHYQEWARVMDKPGKARAFETAQNLEKFGWETLTFRNAYRIFSDYVTGNAEESARRFYDEALPFFVSSWDFFDSTRPARYALAWIDGDEATELRIVRGCGSDNEADLQLQLVHALLHGKYDEARQLLDLTHRFPDNERYAALDKYLPQIPALVDVKHPDHAQAIDTFPKDKGWLFLRWALGRQAFLPTEEMVRLFHDETDGPEGIFAVAAWGDKAHFDSFRALYVKVALDPMEQILIAHEIVKQQGTKPQKHQPALKPVGARPLVDLVREELHRQPKP